MQHLTDTLRLLGAALALLLAATGARAAGLPLPAFLHEGPILLRDIGVIDGMGEPRVAHQDVLIEHGRISALGPHGSLRVPRGAHIIEGAGRTVLPGLIDGHSHLLVNPAERIGDTRNIVAVIKEGKLVDREALAYDPPPAVHQDTAAPSGPPARP